ncbi:hypothetical protein L1887_57249 [Cichorium endivia]|nr:hypothetical protein L1887_57249 [Cichorium endivia]
MSSEISASRAASDEFCNCSPVKTLGGRHGSRKRQRECAGRYRRALNLHPFLPFFLTRKKFRGSVSLPFPFRFFKMSKVPAALNPTEEDISLLLAAQTHIGTKKRRQADGPLHLQASCRRYPPAQHRQRPGRRSFSPARVLAAIENPADICVISGRQYGHRAVLKFAAQTGATAIAGRLHARFVHQLHHPLVQGAPCDRRHRPPRPTTRPSARLRTSTSPASRSSTRDSPLKFVDVAIPRVMPDMFFYRDPEEVEREQQEAAAAAQAAKETAEPAAENTEVQADVPLAVAANLATETGNVDCPAEGAQDWAA